MKNFKWVVFEGVDCCGKSTICKNVLRYFLNQDKHNDLLVSLTTEPYNNIDDILLQFYVSSNLNNFIDFQNYCEDLRANIKFLLSDGLISKELKLKLFLEDRRILLKSYKIWEKCDKDCLVLQDRSYISTLVYQNIYNNKTIYGLMEENREIFQQICDIRPDVIVYLKADKDVILERMFKRNKYDYFDDFAQQNIENLIEKYVYLLNDGFVKSVDCDFRGDILVVDANKPVKECVFDVIEHIENEVM